MYRYRVSTKPTILVADNEGDDAFLLAMAFKRAGSEATVRVVEDGQEALKYLQGDAPYENRSQFPFPDLLLVDLKLPGMSGLELLELVRRRRLSKPLVVGVFTGHEYEPNIQNALEFGAEFCIIKPQSFDELVVVAQHLDEKCTAGSSVLDVMAVPKLSRSACGIGTTILSSKQSMKTLLIQNEMPLLEPRNGARIS